MKSKKKSANVSDLENYNNDNLNTDLILDILGNSTRRKILFVLSKEPLYFNQLSKIVGIGQQSILRHMKILEDSGLIETYTEESNLGAPDRKYYQLASTFSMNIAFFKDGFYIRNKEIKELRYKEFEKFYKEYEEAIAEYHNNKNKNIHSSGLLLDLFKNTLNEIEKEISEHESKINDLHALRQMILKDIHKIGKDNFKFSERQLIYSFIDRYTDSSFCVDELINIFHQKETDFENLVENLITNRFKENKASILEE